MADLRRKWLTIRRADWSWDRATNVKNTPALQALSQAGRARAETSGFLTECYCNCVAASVRPHNTSDSDRCDRKPMATIRGGIIGWYKNRILTRRLT